MQEVQVSFRRPGEGRLSAHLWLPAADGPFPAVVLVAPGEDGDRTVARVFAEEGVAAVRVDVGLSTSGRPSEAIRAALDFIDEEEPRVNRRAIGLFAAGLQATHALRCASVDHRVRALVLSSPSLDAEALALAPRVDAPALVLVDEDPERRERARLFAEAYAGPIDVEPFHAKGKHAIADLTAVALGYFFRTLGRPKKH